MQKIPGLSALLCALVIMVGSASAQTSPVGTGEQNAAALLERHQALVSQLSNNAYDRPIYLESSETPSMVTGNAYAVLNSPLPAIAALLKSPNRWCEVMILHINTKFCKADADTAPTMLHVNVGKKTEQDLADTFSLEFAYRVGASSAEYLAVQLNAEKGPLGTKNYRIDLNAVPLPEGKTFIHLRYSYGYGVASRLAMSAYLATLGSGKIGFTQDNGAYVTGMRGAIERNNMRYYLAIDAYLASLKAPAAQQFNLRLDHWFKATEKYSRQLHEVDLDSYLTMKKNEYQRQKAAS
jgi:hypothetical protein